MGKMSKEFVFQSNQRSIAYGIDKNQKRSKKILSPSELNKKIEEKQELIYVATPFIEQLYYFVKDSDFIVILNDEEGCILNITGNPRMIERAHQTALVPGAYMGEAYIGTNGMGTALHEGKPLQISGEEHFVKIFHEWTCSGAPIRDYDGIITGCLDLTGDKKLVNSHTLGMVAAAAKAIENMLKTRRYANELKNSKNYIESIINTLPLAIFTADFLGNINMANHQIKDILGYSAQEICKMNASDILYDWEKILRRIQQNDWINQEDVYVKLAVNKIEVNLSVHPIKDQREATNELVFVIRDVKKMRKLANKVTGSKAVYTFDKVIGNDRLFLKTLEFAKKIADSRSTVLIMGESGTGKEIFAQSIQNYSQRRDESFVALNCGAIPKNLIESELFGYVEGAFTGAKSGGQPGKFEIADGGTLFLDEIGEMPYELQTRLLRVIEEGVIRRVGGTDEIPIDVRIIAATNKNLKEEVEKRNFRKDLYYRLNVLPIRLPSLRERKSDIPLFWDYFMERKSKRLNKKKVEINKEQIQWLQSYDWPGNIRELENFVELVINTEGMPLVNSHKLQEVIGNKEVVFESMSLDEVEKEHIEKMLQKYHYNISKTAEMLNIGRNTLYRKIDKYQIILP